MWENGGILAGTLLGNITDQKCPSAQLMEEMNENGKRESPAARGEEQPDCWSRACFQRKWSNAEFRAGDCFS